MPEQVNNRVRPMTAGEQAVAQRLMTDTAQIMEGQQERVPVVTQEEARRARTRSARFTKVKETPGTSVFREQPDEGQPEIIGSIYLKKWFAGNATSIVVTVEKG